MPGIPGNGEHDRLGLSKKIPDYEEVKDEGTKLEEVNNVFTPFFSVYKRICYDDTGKSQKYCCNCLLNKKILHCNEGFIS